MSPTLSTHLTREELLTCWALAYTSMFEDYEDAYPLDRYASIGLEGTTNAFGEHLRRAVRYLHFEHGLDFEGLEVQIGGNIEMASEVEPRNAIFLLRAMKNRMNGVEHAAMPIHPVAALEVALSWLPERAPGMDLGPLREALHETERSVEEWKNTMTPEQYEVEEEALDASLKIWGVERRPTN